MTTETYGPRTRAWRNLARHAERLAGRSLQELIAADKDRFDRFAVTAEGFTLDLSRQRLDAAVLEELVALADQTELARWIELMFSGHPVNNTEDRPALHIALRRSASRPVLAYGEDVMKLVERERSRLGEFVEAVRSGTVKGFAGERITDIVNIGIGGSDLGIVMAVQALAEACSPDLRIHFVSNVDGVGLAHVLRDVRPGSTLFVICSKSFTTLETLVNAQGVRAWLLAAGGPAAVAAQCVAVSTNAEAMDEFGIAPDRRFEMWDWVGGRYSVWSAVGLTVALAIGWAAFQEFLAGGSELDEHFHTASFAENLPVLLGLVGIWNRNFLGMAAHAVLPYDDHLARFPAYLQQLEMESNGKSVRRGGEPVECETCPVIWGEPGSNAQHSFYQLLHQGTELVSIDFVLPAKSGVGRQDQHDLAIANCLAQAWALAVGDPDSADKSVGNPHQRYAGNRASSLLMFERLDPRSLGKLVALYEHKVFVQAVIWDVNPFDQWGVQLGKQLASRLGGAVGDPAARVDSAIHGALRTLNELRRRP